MDADCDPLLAAHRLVELGPVGVLARDLAVQPAQVLEGVGEVDDLDVAPSSWPGGVAAGTRVETTNGPLVTFFGDERPVRPPVGGAAPAPTREGHVGQARGRSKLPPVPLIIEAWSARLTRGTWDRSVRARGCAQCS